MRRAQVREVTREEAEDELGICGCGDPEATRLHAIETLESMNSVGADGKLRDLDWSKFQYEDRNQMLVLALLDSKGLIEHGTTIRCSWLTEKGREVLAGLREDDGPGE